MRFHGSEGMARRIRAEVRQDTALKASIPARTSHFLSFPPIRVGCRLAQMARQTKTPFHLVRKGSVTVGAHHVRCARNPCELLGWANDPSRLPLGLFFIVCRET